MDSVYNAKLNTRAGFTCNCEVREWVCVVIATGLIFVDSQTVSHKELAINRGSLFLVFLYGRRERAWYFICLSNGVIYKKVNHFTRCFTVYTS